MVARIVFPLVIAALALLFGLVAWSLPSMPLEEGYGPGLFPGVIAVIVGSLAVIEAVVQFAKAARASPASTAGAVGSVAKPVMATTSLTLGEVGATLAIVGLTIAAVLAIPIVGFIPAAAALVFCLSLGMGMRPIWLSAVAAVAVAAVIHAIFTRVFGLVMTF